MATGNGKGESGGLTTQGCWRGGVFHVSKNPCNWSFVCKIIPRFGQNCSMNGITAPSTDYKCPLPDPDVVGLFRVRKRPFGVVTGC